MGPRRPGGPIARITRPSTALLAAVLAGVGTAASAVNPSAVLAQQAAPRAPALLAAVRGTPPVACDLVVQALGNRFSQPSVRPRVNIPGGVEANERELLDWVGTGRPGPENTAALLDALGSDDACVRRVA